MASVQRKTQMIIAGIMLAVLAWGVFHAVGAYRLNDNPWRAVMVLGCSLAFLGIWSLALVRRRRRSGQTDDDS